MESNDEDLARERELLTGKLVEVQQQVALLASSVPKDSRRHQHLQRQLASTKQKLEALAAAAPPGPHSLGAWIPTRDSRSGGGSADGPRTKDASYIAHEVSTPNALPRSSSRSPARQPRAEEAATLSGMAAPPAPLRDATSQWVPSTPLTPAQTPSHKRGGEDRVVREGGADRGTTMVQARGEDGADRETTMVQAPLPATPARTRDATSLGQLQHSLAQAVRDNQLLWDACGASSTVPASPRFGPPPHRTGWAPPTRSNLTMQQKAEVLEMVQRQEQLRKSTLQVPLNSKP